MCGPTRSEEGSRDRAEFERDGSTTRGGAKATPVRIL